MLLRCLSPGGILSPFCPFLLLFASFVLGISSSPRVHRLACMSRMTSHIHSEITLSPCLCLGNNTVCVCPLHVAQPPADAKPGESALTQALKRGEAGEQHPSLVTDTIWQAGWLACLGGPVIQNARLSPCTASPTHRTREATAYTTGLALPSTALCTEGPSRSPDTHPSQSLARVPCLGPAQTPQAARETVRATHTPRKHLDPFSLLLS